jgi:hypothetical protein
MTHFDLSLTGTTLNPKRGWTVQSGRISINISDLPVSLAICFWAHVICYYFQVHLWVAIPRQKSSSRMYFVLQYMICSVLFTSKSPVRGVPTECYVAGMDLRSGWDGSRLKSISLWIHDTPALRLASSSDLKPDCRERVFKTRK